MGLVNHHRPRRFGRNAKPAKVGVTFPRRSTFTNWAAASVTQTFRKPRARTVSVTAASSLTLLAEFQEGAPNAPLHPKPNRTDGPMSECNVCGAPIFSDEPVTDQPCLDCIMEPHDFTRFDEVMKRLQEWRSADHEDSITIERTYIITIIEGVKALRPVIRTGRMEVRT